MANSNDNTSNDSSKNIGRIFFRVSLIVLAILILGCRGAIFLLDLFGRDYPGESDLVYREEPIDISTSVLFSLAHNRLEVIRPHVIDEIIPFLDEWEDSHTALPGIETCYYPWGFDTWNFTGGAGSFVDNPAASSRSSVYNYSCPGDHPSRFNTVVIVDTTGSDGWKITSIEYCEGDYSTVDENCWIAP